MKCWGLGPQISDPCQPMIPTQFSTNRLLFVGTVEFVDVRIGFTVVTWLIVGQTFGYVTGYGNRIWKNTLGHTLTRDRNLGGAGNFWKAKFSDPPTLKSENSSDFFGGFRGQKLRFLLISSLFSSFFSHFSLPSALSSYIFSFFLTLPHDFPPIFFKSGGHSPMLRYALGTGVRVKYLVGRGETQLDPNQKKPLSRSKFRTPKTLN